MDVALGCLLLRKTSSTPAVVPGAAPALAKAGVGGFLWVFLLLEVFSHPQNQPHQPPHFPEILPRSQNGVLHIFGDTPNVYGTYHDIHPVGGWEHFLFFHILGTIIPTDFHIFQRGRYTTNQTLYTMFCGVNGYHPIGQRDLAHPHSALAR